MKRFFYRVLAIFLVGAGCVLTVHGLRTGQGYPMLISAGLALLAGTVALLLQAGYLSNRIGLVLGICFAGLALFLAVSGRSEGRHDARAVQMKPRSTGPH